MLSAATYGNVSTKDCTKISILIISLLMKYHNTVEMRNRSLKKLSDPYLISLRNAHHSLNILIHYTTLAQNPIGNAVSCKIMAMCRTREKIE